MLKNVVFANPEFFWLLLLIPIAMIWYVFWNKKSKPSLIFSSTFSLQEKPSVLVHLQHLLFVFRIFAFIAVVVALSRPQKRSETAHTKITDGIDIVMAIDVSSSMLARDLKPNRLEALKKVATEFIKNRISDRIGLVVYAGESYTKIPLTMDKSVILNALNDINYGLVEDGTAIGMGLVTAVNRLKESNSKSKIIILLTDGVNNSGFVDPETAAKMATEYGIKVYTIGIGTNGMAMSPIAYNPDGSFVYQNVKVDIDENLMKEISQTTGGQYFRATNNQKLEQIYNEINQLETSEIEEFRYTNIDEKYRSWVILAIGLLFLEFLLRHTIFRSYI